MRMLPQVRLNARLVVTLPWKEAVKTASRKICRRLLVRRPGRMCRSSNEFLRQACVSTALRALHLRVSLSLYRLVQAVLGKSAIAPEKLEAGVSTVILGVQATIKDAGFRCIPDKKKREKWIARIRGALKRGRLTAGEASKLSGALQWATQQQFRKLGRAMIRPIYRYFLLPKVSYKHTISVPCWQADTHKVWKNR